MKSRLRAVVALSTVAWLSAGCVTPHNMYRSTRAAPVHHVVLCWLKDSGNRPHREKIVQVSHSFRDVPGVVDVAVGSVLPSTRAIVDSSFDVGILVTFETEADMKKYLVHPTHVKATKDVLRPLVRKIVVYDFIAEDHR